MNLGVIEAELLPAVQRAVGEQAHVSAGPPVVGPVTGMKFDVWVHAARFEDLGGVTAEGAVTARRPLRLSSRQRGFAEERPARIIIEITCTGPTAGGVYAICEAIPAAVLPALETMPDPELSALPNRTVAFRFADFTAVVAGAAVAHRVVGEAGHFVGLITFGLDGFLHVTVARRGGLVRRPPSAPAGRAAIHLRVVQGPAGADASGEHVVITNAGSETLDLSRYVLQDNAPKRPNRFVIPSVTLAPARSLRIWTGKGKSNAENLYWGRAKSVWNNPIDRASLLDPAGAEVASTTYPEWEEY